MENEFLKVHQLSERYLTVAADYFVPVAQWFVERIKVKRQPLLIGINGSQGADKSTLADFWVRWMQAQGFKACAVSIDDFYFNKATRQTLATTVHPLMATRGVPGTHDVAAASDFFARLQANDLPLQIPRFNKAVDDPFPQSRWPVLTEPLDIVFFEGWCVGSLPQDEAALAEPINDLEAAEDAQGIWRHYVNAQLRGPYADLFGLLDYLILLKAPSFDCVANWRWAQEAQLAAGLTAAERAAATGLMTREQVNRFVSFYERITRDNIARLPDCSDIVYRLSETRDIEAVSGRCAGAIVNSDS